MPDPLLYLQAFVAAAGVSALVVLALRWRQTSSSAIRVTGVCVAGVAVGQAAGVYWLRLSINWPPASALDRYLTILLPATLLVEILAASTSLPRWIVQSLRCILLASIGRVLLHGSVYLDEWTIGQAVFVLAVVAILPLAAWLLLAQLAERSPSISLPLTLALTVQGAGLAIMLAGYLKGGAAATVAAAALLGASTAFASVAKEAPPQALVGLGVVTLSSLLLIGVFFGRLPAVSAVVLFAAPQLCWLTELHWFPQRNWLRGTVRLALTAAVIAVVLLFAIWKFDREFRPLLGQSSGTNGQPINN
jgi:hypothetical protein